MTSEEIEKKIRNFLVEEMLKEQAAVAERNEPLDFDSLDQTGLRVYIEEAFSADVARLEQPFATIGQIVDFVASSSSPH